MNQSAETDQVNQELFAQLGRIVADIDPVPDIVYAAGRAALELRRVDAELAELVRDSAVDTESPLTVRGELNVRLLSFEAAELDIELQVMPQAGRRSLLGQVVGAVADVRLETSEGLVSAELDEHGRFQVDDIPAGWIRLHVNAGATSYATNWVSI